MKFTKFSVNLPPDGVDILLYMRDGSAVAVVNSVLCEGGLQVQDLTDLVWKKFLESDAVEELAQTSNLYGTEYLWCKLSDFVNDVDNDI